MNFIKRIYQSYKKDLSLFWYKLVRTTCGGWMPDGLYLRLIYRIIMGRKLHLNNPITFTEKIQWLKIHNRKPEFTIMVDKYAVKEYVSGILGAEHVIPTLGVWNRPEDIDFGALPDQFVLKPTQGAGGNEVIVCKDKNNFDKGAAIQKLNNGLRQDSYRTLREWPYKDVPRRIIAEKYMEDYGVETDGLTDYKFYCFNGDPKFCQVITNRTSQETIDFYDMNWEHQEFIGLNKRAIHSHVQLHRPKHYEEMQMMAKKLSEGLPFSRIDLYEINDRTYFGEITFFPGSGFGTFTPDNYNFLLGEMIHLSGMGGGDS